ncbi:MAG: sigma-70 family RNA polymerase sigma factor [Verrucomicrobia bacterium]|nr:sigma-70 family RNA polymerase sigma factor [Verrucomicrobiota bacterium]
MEKMRMSMDDWELLRAYGDGSEAAFAELVRRHVDHVYSTALRRVNDPMTAQDVVQRVFCLLARKAASLDASGSLIGWLHRSAVHVSQEALRSDRRRRDRETAAWQLNVMPSEPAPTSAVPSEASSDAVWRQVAPELDAALLDLPEPDRLAVLLRFFQQLPNREVGVRLGVSEAAAKMRIGRAILKLRRMLGSRGVVLTAGALAWLLTERTVSAAPAGCAGTAMAAATATSAAVSPWAALLALVTRVPFPVAVGVTALGIATAVFTMALRPDSGIRSGAGAALILPELSESNAAAMDLDALDVAGVAGAAADPMDDPAALRLAIENLRSVIRKPYQRRLPVDLVAEAVRPLGRHGAAAVPMILEELRATIRPLASRNDVSVTMGIQAMSLEALRALGPAGRDAIPELLVLIGEGRLAALNDSVARVIPALDPTPGQIDALVHLVLTSDAPGIQWGGQAVVAALEQRPEAREAALAALQAALDSGSDARRLRIAGMLAQIPGSDPSRLRPVLEEHLRLAALRDPSHYLPITHDGDTDYGPAEQRNFDDVDRMSAVYGLVRLGEDARESLPALEELARRTENAQLRDQVLRAIGALDPDRRLAHPEVAAAVDSWEADQALADRANRGDLTPGDLRTGLRGKRTADASASHIATLGERGRQYVPDLLEALQRHGSFEAAQVLKRLAPEQLVQCLKNPAAFTPVELLVSPAEENPAQRALTQAAMALGELGPAAAFALPALREALEVPDKQWLRLTLDESIRAIDPNAPPAVFKGEAIWPMNKALIEARDLAERAGRPDRARLANDTSVRMELNHGMTRRELLAIGAELESADPELHAVYMQSLWQANPGLRGTP